MNPVASYYQKISTYYDEKYRAFIEQQWQVIEKNLKDYPTKPKRILDLGCGTGEFLLRLSHIFPEAELVGVDLSPTQLDLARKKIPHAKFIESDIASVKLEGEFDLILCLTVLHHLTHPLNLLKRIKFLASQSAQVYISILAFDSLPMRMMGAWWKLIYKSHRHSLTTPLVEKWIRKYFFLRQSNLLKIDRFWRVRVFFV